MYSPASTSTFTVLWPEGRALAADFDFDALPRGGVGYAAVSCPAPTGRRGGNRCRHAQHCRTSPDARRVARSGKSGETPGAQECGVPEELDCRPSLGLQVGCRCPLRPANRRRPTSHGLTRFLVADVNRVARKSVSWIMQYRASASAAKLRRAGAIQCRFGGQESIALGEAKGGALPDWADGAVGRPGFAPRADAPTGGQHASQWRDPYRAADQEVSDTVSIFGHIRNRPEVEEPAAARTVYPSFSANSHLGPRPMTDRLPAGFGRDWRRGKSRDEL